jgi:hypothetical protein
MTDEQDVEREDGDGPKKKDKVADLRQKLEEHVALVATREQDLTDARTDKQRATAEERLGKARAKVEEFRRKLRREEVLAKHRAATDALAAARRAVEDAELEGFSTLELGDQFEGVLIDRLDELGGLRATVNRLNARAKELTDLVRVWVAANPTGWVAGVEDPECKYLCWIGKDGQHGVILEDNPTYGMTVDQVFGLVGFQAAAPFLEANYTALEDAAQNGLLKDTKGEPITVDQLREMRTRTERTKKVKPFNPSGADVGPLVDAINPELTEAFVETLEPLGLDGNTVRALHAAGITRVGQVRCLSGDDLAKIKGIGPVRAGQIISAVVRRAT